MKITKENHLQVYDGLKTFYAESIQEIANRVGYRELSRQLQHDDTFINQVLRRDALPALKRLYCDIIEKLN